MVWVSLGQLVDECHSLPCQGHYRASKAVPWKVHNNHWQEQCCLFVMTHTHTHRQAHILYLYMHSSCTLTHTNTHTLSTFIQYLCSQVAFWDQFGETARVRICVSHSEVCVHAVFPYVCVWLYMLVCVCVSVAARLCCYHHYPSQYPHVHVLITLESMSDEGSQAAESLVDLLRLLLRPHSEINSSSAKDHLQGKIIGSLTALQAALKAHQITVYQIKMHVVASACFYFFQRKRCVF